MFVKRFMFLLFFIFFSSFLNAQTQKELEKMSYSTISDSFFSNENNLKKQLYYANADLSKSTNSEEKIRIAWSYYLFYLLNRVKHKERAIAYLDSVIKYSYNSGDAFFPISAFNEKASLLGELGKYEETISCYLLAEKYAKDRNYQNSYYEVRHQIGMFKSEMLGELDEALALYLECKKYYEKQNIKEPFFAFKYQRVLFGLADVHKSKKNLDSASFYNKLGYNEAQYSKSQHLKNLFILNEGATQIENDNYQVGLDSINKAYPKIKEMNDLGNTLASYYYYGRYYEGTKDKKKAVLYYLKVDSLYKVRRHITPEFVSGYHYLIKYYKEERDFKNQLKYLTTFITIDSSLQKGYKSWNKLFKDQYDVPHLMKDKDAVINSIRKEKASNYIAMAILACILLGAVLFGIYQVRLKKRYQSSFDKLIVENKEIELSSTTLLNKSNETVNPLDISKEIVDSVLEKLALFEKEKRYLNASLTINALAQDFNTNTKYLSAIINNTQEKSFIHYINDLRIDAIVSELKSNKNLRKFTISGIAEEAGFNNGESFSKAFFKRTGIKPSYYIKKLEGIKILNTI